MSDCKSNSDDNKKSIQQNKPESYLGSKGYSILKSSITVEKQQMIRERLTVKPYVPKAPVQPESFEVYRESKKKLYIPRFIGIELFGMPNREKISKGIDISLKFAGKLRDYQQKVVDIYLKQAKTQYGGLLEIPCGRGKTVIGLNIISRLKKKTLVIVHKGFLVDQWVERIEQFLPDARVGRIQGQIIDVDDKDIVIGMLQSLSMKEYPDDMFSSFGLTIVDETHHIAAEVFVRSLFKVVTFNVLGLSATMQRKDGLTKVFKMFLGDIIYKEKRTQDDDVLVKAIHYSTDDEEFNEIKYDYRGNPQYSTMIVKLCNFSFRSEFILKVLEKTLEDKRNKQIMILAHNKSLLTYLFKAIEHRNIATVGYYIGGMKAADLKETESKKIIVATYAMAAEALDIKTLTTLILATPKTDVTQAVGRILRVKHEQPLVIDIVDSHDVFVKQWKKRRQFYIKNKYKITETNNNNFHKDVWDVTYEKGDKGKKMMEKIKKKENPLVGQCLIEM